MLKENFKVGRRKKGATPGSKAEPGAANTAGGAGPPATDRERESRAEAGHSSGGQAERAEHRAERANGEQPAGPTGSGPPTAGEDSASEAGPGRGGDRAATAPGAARPTRKKTGTHRNPSSKERRVDRMGPAAPYLRTGLGGRGTPVKAPHPRRGEGGAEQPLGLYGGRTPTNNLFSGRRGVSPLSK